MFDGQQGQTEQLQREREAALQRERGLALQCEQEAELRLGREAEEMALTRRKRWWSWLGPGSRKSSHLRKTREPRQR